MMNDIAKDLAKEIAEQKKIGRGVLHRATRKKGFRGAVKLPYEYLKGKEKKEYMGPTNETIIDLKQPMDIEAFKKLSQSQQKQQLEIYAHAYGYSTRCMALPLGISQTGMYHLCKKLDLTQWLIEKNANVSKEKKEEQKRNRSLLTISERPEQPEGETFVVTDETTPAQPENAVQPKNVVADANPARLMRVSNISGTDKPAAIAQTIAAILAAYDPDEDITIAFEVK